VSGLFSVYFAMLRYLSYEIDTYLREFSMPRASECFSHSHSSYLLDSRICKYRGGLRSGGLRSPEDTQAYQSPSQPPDMVSTECPCVALRLSLQESCSLRNSFSGSQKRMLAQGSHKQCGTAHLYPAMSLNLPQVPQYMPSGGPQVEL
jgi:hypothetical protein